jgi:hypothetical protein
MADTVFQVGYFKKGFFVAKKWSFMLTKLIKLLAFVSKYIFKLTFKASDFLKFEVQICYSIEKFLAFYIDQSTPDI